MANRRKFLAGLGALASGSAAAVGTGAFTSVSAERSVSVSITDDSSAYLTLTQAGTGPNSQYAETTGNGEITINLDNSDTPDGGAGLNKNAETDIFDIFKIRNEGTQPVFVYVEPSSVTDYVTPDAGGGYAEGQNGVYIDPQASNRPNDAAGNFEGQAISMTGVYGVNDPTAGFEASDSGSLDLKGEDLTLDVGESLDFGLFVRTASSVVSDFDVSMNIVADSDLALLPGQ